MADLRKYGRKCALPNKRIMSKLIPPKKMYACKDGQLPFVQLTSTIKKWLTIITFSGYALTFLSALQAAFGLFVLYQVPNVKALKFAALCLGTCGGILGLVCVSTLRGANVNHFLTKPRDALDQLSFFFNMGILFSIFFFGFAICILNIHSIFWSSHMLGDLVYLDNGNAIGQIRAIVMGLVILSSTSCLMCLVCMAGCILFRPSYLSPDVNGQTFLWLTLISGICGSIILSIAIYAPVKLPYLLSNTIENIMHGLGFGLLCAAAISIGRFSIGKPKHKSIRKLSEKNKKKRKSKSKNLCGQMHIALVVFLALTAAVLCVSFLLHAETINQSADPTLQSSKASKLLHVNAEHHLYTKTKTPFGEKNKVQKTKRKNVIDALTKKMQYYVLGSFMLMVSLYTLANGVMTTKILLFHKRYC